MLSQDDYIKLSAKLIENSIQKVFSSVVSFGKDQYKKMQVKAQDSFEKYLDTAIRKYSYTKTILYKHSPTYLYDIYVNTNLLFDTVPVSTDNINDIFDLGKSMIFTGTGGCGKSTLLKHLFLNSIVNCNCIPIYIELKDLKNFDSEANNIIDYIYYSLCSMNFNLEKEYFLYSFDKCNIVIFFDGLDEVDDSKLEKVTNDIIRLNDKYSNLHIVVSTRPVENGFASWTNFAEMSIMPMSKPQSVELISKVKFNKVIKDNFLKDLENNLYDKFISFASNPLLLTIMLLTYSDYAEIPDKMHLFYEEAFEVLYRKHDANKEGVFVREFKTNLSKDLFERLLSCISLLSYYENHFSFRKKEAILYIDRAKKLTGIEVDSESYLTDLLQSVCILQLEGSKYSYSHRSFQEYFTALYILNSGYTMQNKLLEKLPVRYNIDTVLSLLFDMNKGMIEENMIIPKLKELKNIIDYDNVSKKQSLVNFLKLSFDEIRFRLSKDGEGSYLALRSLLRYVDMEGGNKNYLEIVRFIDRKYNKEEKVEMYTKITAELYHKKIKGVRFKIDDLLVNDELFEIFISNHKIPRQLEISLSLLDILVTEHRHQEETIDNILILN